MVRIYSSRVTTLKQLVLKQLNSSKLTTQIHM